MDSCKSSCAPECGETGKCTYPFKCLPKDYLETNQCKHMGEYDNYCDGRVCGDCRTTPPAVICEEGETKVQEKCWDGSVIKCKCADGNWLCPEIACAPREGCEEGDTKIRERCWDGSVIECICENGGWTCPTIACPPKPECEEDEVKEGITCDDGTYAGDCTCSDRAWGCPICAEEDT